MGYVHLLEKNYSKSDSHFETSLENAVKKDHEWMYRPYTRLADLSFIDKAWDKSAEMALLALEELSNDPAAVNLTLALEAGLSEEYRLHYLIYPEIVNAIRRYQEEGDLEYLRPIVHFMNIPATSSTAGILC